MPGDSVGVFRCFIFTYELDEFMFNPSGPDASMYVCSQNETQFMINNEAGVLYEYVTDLLSLVRSQRFAVCCGFADSGAFSQ